MYIAPLYHAQQSLTPIWHGEVLYHESVMYLEDEYRARLLYTPTEEFLRITGSHDGRTDDQRTHRLA